MGGLNKPSKFTFYYWDYFLDYFSRISYSRSLKRIQEENRANSMMHTIAKLRLMELGEEKQFKRFQEHISSSEISTDEE